MPGVFDAAQREEEKRGVPSMPRLISVADLSVAERLVSTPSSRCDTSEAVARKARANTVRPA
ncbi:MAG: hypothetical protein GX458_02200 [Phyllobacteriaceae bacterium]|nr:hypothetical protein [Phyllobacteriaceae bacterium]